MVAAVFLVLICSVDLFSCVRPGSDHHIRCDLPGSDRRAKSACNHDNIVHTTHGDIRGQTKNVRVSNGRQVPVDVFWGIPYAKPPVGDRRFRPPVSSDPWNGVLQTTTPPNSCIQVLLDSLPLPNPTTPLGEDCLFLNIWRPCCKGANQSLATMVWLHTGGYFYGSSTVRLYNGEHLAASQCVIVASINYRLGALGFMYLATPESPGNMGLLDMTLALTWIQANVGTFGGDPDKITLFGNSAGASAVSSFLMSRLTRHLFRNVIMELFLIDVVPNSHMPRVLTRLCSDTNSFDNMCDLLFLSSHYSGTPLIRFTHQSRKSALDAALELARRLNCSSESRTTTVACLRQVNATDLAVQHLQMASNFSYMMVAVTDGHLLTKDPRVYLLTGDFKRCDVLVGTASNEGSFFLFLADPGQYSLRKPTPPGNLTDQELDQALAGVLSLLVKPEYIPLMTPDIKDIYDLDQLRQEVTEPTLKLLTQVAGDLIAVCPQRLQATLFANASQNVYLYSFNHGRDVTKLPEWVGATHTIELAFIFGTTSTDFPEFSRRELQLSRDLMKLWANFAKFGNPTPGSGDTPRWPRYTPPDPAPVLVFTESAKIKVGRTENRRCDYWNGLPVDYFLD